MFEETQKVISFTTELTLHTLVKLTMVVIRSLTSDNRLTSCHSVQLVASATLAKSQWAFLRECF